MHRISRLTPPRPGLLVAAALLLAAVTAAGAASPGPAAAAPEPMHSAGGVLYPAGFYGVHAKGVDQVDEIVEAADRALKDAGVHEGIGAMMQHTIYMKDGALSPMDVLNRFHAVARRLAPSLKPEPSVGTILRVPGFEDPRTVVAVDLSAAPAGEAAHLDRVLFKFGPHEIGQSIATGKLVFSAGLEAMDFEHGTLAPTIEQQVDAVTGKLVQTMKDAGVSVGQMVSHNLYVARGNDPLKVAELFHASLKARLPDLLAAQSVGTLVVVDGMAGPGFRLEMDAVATRGEASQVRRIPYVPALPISKAAAVDEVVFTSSIDSLPQGDRTAVPAGAQAQARLVAHRVADAVKAAGGSASGIVKVKLYVKTGNDVTRVHRTFASALRALGASDPAYTVIVVESLEDPALECVATAIAAGHPPAGRR